MPTTDLALVLVVFIAYGLGCFSTAYYLVRWRTGQDIRALGSGSAGARNAGRVLGKSGFVVAFLGDMLKGALAIWFARWLGVGQWGESAALVAVVLGHLFPAQLGWRGGKGAATGFGAALVISWLLGLLCVLVAAIWFAFSRSFTMSGLVAFVAAPLLAYLIGLPAPYLTGLLIIVALLLFAHRGNIRALHSGVKA